MKIKDVSFLRVNYRLDFNNEVTGEALQNNLRSRTSDFESRVINYASTIYKSDMEFIEIQSTVISEGLLDCEGPLCEGNH